MAGQRPTLIGIPWDANSSFLRGAAGAAPPVREALFSPASNMWTEFGVDLGAPGRLADACDLVLPDSADAIGIIEGAVGLLLEDGGAPIAIGGDHAVTYPILRAIGRRHPGLTILHVDATSPTGATALYESVGMVADSETVVFHRALFR